MGLPKILTNIFSSGAKDLVDSVGNIIDNVVTTKEEKEQLKLEIQKEINRALEAASDKALKQTEMELADVQSARSREIELAKAGAKDNTPKWLAYIAVVGFLGIVVFLMVHGIGSLDREVILLLGSLIGILGANSQTVYNYFFGSSAGSKAKSAQLDEMQKTITDGKA